MQEHHLRVARTARYGTLGPFDAAAREVWFVLHGYGQRAATFVRSFRALDDGRRLLVAPEGLSRFYLDGTGGRVGASWMTREDRLHEIDDYVAYLNALYAHVFARLDRRAVRVQVLGFSQGAATATRWLALGTAAADRLILWAGDVAHDLDLDVHAPALRRLGLTLVLGTRDAYVTPERLAAQTARLEGHAIPYRLLRFEGGHRLDDAVLRRLVT